MIRAAIRSGELTANQPLTEAGLARWCGVSRTPVRDALARLEHEELIVRTPRGPVVRSRSLEEIFNIYEVRIVLEATAARHAAERRTARDLVLLRFAVEQYEGVPTQKVGERVATARNFHEAVWRASRNETLSEILARLDSLVPRYLSDSATRERTVLQHRDILRAISDGDGDAAAEAATIHYTESRDIRLKECAGIEAPVDMAGDD